MNVGKMENVVVISCNMDHGDMFKPNKMDGTFPKKSLQHMNQVVNICGIMFRGLPGWTWNIV
jgi:hypothetical protein